jgi:hypothetical protein
MTADPGRNLAPSKILREPQHQETALPGVQVPDQFLKVTMDVAKLLRWIKRYGYGLKLVRIHGLNQTLPAEAMSLIGRAAISEHGQEPAGNIVYLFPSLQGNEDGLLDEILPVRAGDLIARQDSEHPRT